MNSAPLKEEKAIHSMNQLEKLEAAKAAWPV